MVNLSPIGGRDRIADILSRLFNTEARGARARAGVSMSQRELQRLTGLPRSTVQDFLANPNRARNATVDRIIRAIESPNVRRTAEGVTTMRVDAPVFTPEVFASMPRDPRAQSFRYVYEAEGYTASGFATTDFLDIETLGTENSLLHVPGGADAVRRVVFDIA